jgi:transglutaminase-like putative cysteine protease
MAQPVEMTSWIGDDNDAIRELVRDRMIPRIKDAAESRTVREWARINFAQVTQAEEAESILYWVRRHMLYTPDPPDIEHVKWPSALFDEIRRLGHATGDCDDYVMLYAAITRARDIPTQLRITARKPVVDGTGEYQFDHIYTRVKPDYGGAWIPVDPSSEGAMGWETTERYLTEDFDA